MNCIYENEFMLNGLTQSYGLEHNCGFKSTDKELCDKCLEYAKNRQKIYFEQLGMKEL